MAMIPGLDHGDCERIMHMLRHHMANLAMLAEQGNTHGVLPGATVPR